MLLSAIPIGIHAAGLNNFVQKVQKYEFSISKFTDVNENDWFLDNVKAVYEKGLMNGNSESTFNPTGDVKLSEVVTIATRLHSIYTTGSDAVADVAGSVSWYDKYVAYAKENAIITSEYEDYGRAATRAEFAVILASALPEEALEGMNTVDDDIIPDVVISDEYGAAVYKLYRAGILTGNNTKGTFAPQSGIQRSEVAAIASRMADKALRVRFDLISFYGTVKREYNDRGNLVKETAYDEQGKLKDRWEGKYDELDRLTMEYFQSGRSREHVYDDRGNLIELISYKSSGSLQEKRVYTYNDKNQIVDVKLYDSSVEIVNWEKYEYDARGNRCKAEAFDASGKILFKIERTYDEKDRITAKSYFDGTGKLIDSLEVTYNDSNNTAAMLIKGDIQKTSTEVNVSFNDKYYPAHIETLDHDLYADVHNEYFLEYDENGEVVKVGIKSHLMTQTATYEYECEPYTTSAEILIRMLLNKLELRPFVETDK